MLRAASNWVWTHVALLTILSTSSATCQAPQRPHFEVASIRPGGDIFSTKPQFSPGRLVWTTQLAYLIGYAYGLDFSRVSGPGLGAIYTVNAVSDRNATDDERRLMLQSLLADRFNMRFHQQVKEVDGFAVTIGKAGIKMKESAAVSQHGPGASGSGTSSPSVNESYLSATMPSSGVTAIRAKEATLKQLTDTLGRITGMAFWDRTGLQGKYDFAFSFSQDLNADPQTEVPSLSTALRESLGLTMQKQRGPVETLVIDHLEQPSEN
jgi:uncharacterized protein (TIGR03435 family)